MKGENAPPPDGWKLPPRHCGLWCNERACPVCGEWVVPEHIQLGEN